MKKSFRFAALIMAMLFISTGLAVTAFANPTADEVYNVTFALNGEGSISIYYYDNTSVATITSNSSQTLALTRAVKFKVDGSITDISWTEPQRAVDGEYYYLVPSRDSSVTVTVVGGNPNNNPGTIDPENPNNSASDCTIRVNVSSGGTVTAGERTINGGNGTNILVKTGDSLVFNITPDDGYELESFRINEIVAEITDNTYTLSNITGSSTISVTFKTIGAAVPSGISATDIDWSANPITVDVTGGKMVLREVLDKIATLTPEADKYVQFVSENGTIYIPYGGISIGAESVSLSVAALAEGEELTDISGLFGSNPFKAYSFNVAGNTLPAGTMVSFNLGADFANKNISLLYYDGTKLTQNGDAVATSGEGVTGMYAYNNDIILVCAEGLPGKFTIESILLNTGGNINPNGINEVAPGETVNYTVNAIDGYSIKQILVNGEVISGAEGNDVYIYTFENVQADHKIEVEFLQDAETSDDAQDDGGNGTVIVILVIVLVAVLGAAALFIVKWRQEKF